MTFHVGQAVISDVLMCLVYILTSKLHVLGYTVSIIHFITG